MTEESKALNIGKSVVGIGGIIAILAGLYSIIHPMVDKSIDAKLNGVIEKVNGCNERSTRNANRLDKIFGDLYGPHNSR